MENLILLLAYFWAACAFLSVACGVSLVMGWIDWNDL